MSPEFAYFYFMADKPEAVRETAPAHAGYWQAQNLPGYAGGPFADHSGGLILFRAENEDAARALVSKDPFAARGLLDASWLKPWRRHD